MIGWTKVMSVKNKINEMSEMRMECFHCEIHRQRNDEYHCD